MITVLLSIFIFGILLIIFWVQRRVPLRIARWRKTLSLEEHAAVFNTLYEKVNGYSLSHEARIAKDAPEFVYGEIEIESFIALLSQCNVNSNTVFYDLGSGTGKAVLACAMVFGVRKSCGIELFTGLYEASLAQLKDLAGNPNYRQIAKRIRFINADFLTVPIQDATLLFMNSTAFFGDFWTKISKHLEQLQPGAIVISASKAVASESYSVKQVTEVAMGWGVITVYIQERRSPIVD